MIKHKAFTLIELLVVFAVIGLLVGIILASVKSVRDRASIAKTVAYGKSLDNLLAADAVGIWNFDDQTNPTKDTSGWANHGTINGATFTTDTPHKTAGAGAGKYSLSFDGMDDFVQVNDSGSNVLDLGNTFTFSAWVKPYDSSDRMIFNKESSYEWKCSAGIIKWAIMTAGSWSWRDTGATCLPNEWGHFVLVYNGSIVQTYKNGELKSTQNDDNSGPLDKNDENLCIGGRGGDGCPGAEDFSGKIDEVRIFSRALSQTEIQKLYAEGAAGHGIVLK